MNLRAIMRMTPSGALALHERVRSRDVGAAQDFVLYSVWHKIRNDPAISQEKKEPVFKALAARVNITVETNG